MNNELGWTGTHKAGRREVSAQNTGRCREKDEGTEGRGAKTDGKVTERAGEGGGEGGGGGGGGGRSDTANTCIMTVTGRENRPAPQHGSVHMGTKKGDHHKPAHSPSRFHGDSAFSPQSLQSRFQLS